MQNKIRCIIGSILSISLASVILVLFLCPENYVFGAKTPQIQEKGSNVPYYEKTLKTQPDAISGQITILPSSTVENYIVEQAEIEGVSETVVKWIVSHESQWGQRIVGDNGNSRGDWMISRIYHPEVSDWCSFNLQCSTAWSLNWIKKGNENQWTTYRLRCKLYPKDNPPNCNE